MYALFLTALYLAIMNVSFQSQIGFPAVGSDRASRRNRLSNEPVQPRAGRVRYRTQADAPDALSLCPSADCAGFFSAPVGLVHLDNAIQPVAAGANHGPTQLMQHRPGRL